MRASRLIHLARTSALTRAGRIGLLRPPSASALVVVALFGIATGAQPPQAVFTAEDMLGVRTFLMGQPIALAPTGKWIAYVLTDLADEGTPASGHVYVQALAGMQPGTSRALTSGQLHGAFPVWSPDGRRLAFLREDAAGGQLAIWDSDTDRITPIGDRLETRTFLAPQWDPSGQHIVYTLPVRKKEPGPKPRVIVVESTDPRIPGDQFFTNDRQANLAVADVASGRTTTLLAAPVALRSFQVSPTGHRVLYVAPSPETLGIIGTLGRKGREINETFVVPVSAGPPRKIIVSDDGPRFSWAPDGQRLLFAKEGKLQAVSVEGGAPQPFLPNLTIRVGDLVWAPDGKRFGTLVADESIRDPEIEAPKPGMHSIAQPFMDLYLVSVSDGAARNLTSSFEDQVSEPIWSPDGESVYFETTNNQTYDEAVYRYTVADQTLRLLTRGEESYGPPRVAPGALSLVIEDATHPRDLWLLDRDARSRRRITDLNPQLSRFRFSRPELFFYYNADGERLGALLYKPVGFEQGQQAPVITWVYEKLTPNIHRFNPRDQIWLNHGYAMLMPNVKIKVGTPATSFVKCVVPAVNAVRAMGFTNGKFGLWGHSFGAYATSNIITQTDIFACAVSGATPPELFRNWASGRDRDSRNIETGQARMGGTPFDYPERYLSQSAFFHLDKVKTPVLMLHGEQDYTILFGEGEMMFYALRQLGKTATFVIYPYGDHGLTRRVRSDILDVNRRILEWFDRYLKTPAATRSQ